MKDRKKISGNFLFFIVLNQHEFGSEDETPEAFWLFAPGTSSSAAGSACKWTDILPSPPGMLMCINTLHMCFQTRFCPTNRSE